MSVEQAGVRAGDVIAGKYRVDKVLGVGGMGVVVAAHHIDLDERVAIKFLLPDVLGNQDAVIRFAREARAAVKIKSEHVAKVTDVGRLENGAPYMVMEYLEGRDLAAWLSQQGPLAPDLAVDFLLQACEAIAEAHTLGIVHRDLKPGNLFVTRRPDGALAVKVLDFGISKMADRGSSSGPSMTATSAMMGSPLYMSPEQMHSSRDVDQRSDIWALGVILHELLTGEPPFTAGSMPELVLRIVHSPPTPLREKRPDLPETLEQVILHCLNKDRNGRFANVGELAMALLQFGTRRSRQSVERISGVMGTGFSGTSTALPPSSGSGGAVSAGTGASWGKTDAAPRRRSSWPVAVGVLAVGGLGLGGWLVLGRSASHANAEGVDAGPSAVAASLTAPPVTAAAAQPPAVTPLPSPAVAASDPPAVAPLPSAEAAAPSKPGTAPATRTTRGKPGTRGKPTPGPSVKESPAVTESRPAAAKVDIFDDRK